MNLSDILMQLVAILAFSGYALAFYLPERRRILGWQFLFLLVWAGHFLFLGAWVGAVMIGINAFKSLLFYFKRDDNWIGRPVVLYGWLLIFLVLMLFFWEGWFSLLPWLAVSFVTVANWQMDVQKLRWIILPSNGFWFVYNLLVGSSGGMIAETIMFIMVIGSIIKHKRIGMK